MPNISIIFVNQFILNHFCEVVYLLHLKKASHGGIVDGCETLFVKGVGVPPPPDYSSNKWQRTCFGCLHQHCDTSFLNRGEEKRGKGDQSSVLLVLRAHRGHLFLFTWCAALGSAPASSIMRHNGVLGICSHINWKTWVPCADTLLASAPHLSNTCRQRLWRLVG